MDATFSESAEISENTINLYKTKSNISSFQSKRSHSITVNEESLKREMADILGMMTSYLKDIEAAARARRLKRTNHITGDYKDFCKGEKRFLMRLEYGKGIMSATMESLKVVPDLNSGGKLPASDLYGRINDFIQKGSSRSMTANIQEMSFYLSELMIRFARICESEGFRHGLPINSFRPIAVNKERTYIYQRKVKKILQEGEEQDETEEQTKSTIDEKNGQNVPENRLSSEVITLCDTGTDAKDRRF